MPETWEDTWAGMSPEEQALYNQAMGGSAAAASLSSLESSLQAQRDAFANLPLGEQLRIASAGADRPTTVGVLGDDGTYYTDPAVAAAIGKTGINQAGPTLYRRAKELMDGGQTQEALAMLQQYDPATWSMLTNKETQGIDYLGGQSMRPLDADYDAMVKRRFEAFEGAGYQNMDMRFMGGYTEGTISGGTLLDLATGLPISSAYDLTTGDIPSVEAGLLDVASLGGAPIASIYEGAGAAKVNVENTRPQTTEDLQDWVRGLTDPTGLDLDFGLSDKLADQIGEGGTLGTQGQLPAVDDVFQTPGGGDGTASSVAGSAAGAAAAVTPLNRSDFEVARVDDPWVTDEMRNLPGQLWTEGMNYVPATAPTISEGSPEMLAAYEDAIRKQMGIAEGVELSAEQQAELVRQMGEGRALYEAAARGEAPSVAALQMQQGIDQAARNALSIAATSRDPGGYYRAARSMGNLRNQGVIEQSILRAKEMEAARAGLTAYLGTEATAGAYATAGGAQAAGAQQQITQDMITRLAQQQGISEEQARIDLQNRAQEQANRTNIMNTGINAFNARTSAMTGAAGENAAVAAGQRAFAETQADMETTVRGQDVGAATNRDVAMISSQTTRDIEAERNRRADKEAMVKGATTLGMLGYNAMTDGSKEEEEPIEPATEINRTPGW